MCLKGAHLKLKLHVAKSDRKKGEHFFIKLLTNFRNQSFKYIFVIILYWDYDSMVYITTKLTILIPKNL